MYYNSYMNFKLCIPLNATEEQLARLLLLQGAFAKVCNALAPVVQKTKVWNRVALHHLAYRSLREKFPELGSQMACNAIYSVSRTCRILFQSPQSPFNQKLLDAKPMPLLHFNDTCPVYFDRHTLSIKGGQLSMFTLDGRMRFAISLKAEDEEKFKTLKLREVVLNRTSAKQFELNFTLGESQDDAPILTNELPDYLMVSPT